MTSLTHQLIQLGLGAEDAEHIENTIEYTLKTTSSEICWQKIQKDFLTTAYPSTYSFAIHEALYKYIYPNWDKLPAPAWFPLTPFIETTNLRKIMQPHSNSDVNVLDQNLYLTFHRWSVSKYPDFWETMIKTLNIVFDTPYDSIVDLNKGIESPQWFPNATLNIANSCFPENSLYQTAIVSQNEQGISKKITYNDLNKLSNRVANSLIKSKKLEKGDSIAIIMPMTIEAVAIYLGIIKAGFTIVSIADSFSADEIAIRLKIAHAKAIFCQDYIVRDGKNLPLYEKIIQAFQMLKQNSKNKKFSIEQIVVIATKKLENNEFQNAVSWQDFLCNNDHFIPVSCNPEDFINILFSSGTTGDPKAIPWTQTAPIKCATDAYLHHNLKPNDIFCWPSNLGWMMGPWLIFACLINGATIALYEGVPTTQSFGKFIQDAKVTLLGVVPTLVKAWRNSKCMEPLDWSAIQLFTSTGECSNIEDMLYLMHLTNYCPIIEYCGGTEISGAYITSTVLQPSAPAACTGPAVGLDFVIINEEGELSDEGEVAIIPPSIGLSTILLNKNHHVVYYDKMPSLTHSYTLRPLRRHGDYIVRYSNGYYRLQGRSDDTMNLGGIKVSSAEIERILNTHCDIQETAAVAIDPAGGGPSLLVIYVVPHSKDIDININAKTLKDKMQNIIKQHLNPLFKIHEVVILEALPRTASNKIMRRLLRS